MANSLSGGTFGAMSPTYWSRRMGRKLYKTDVFRSLANFEEQATLKDGQRVDRPYRSDIVVENYTKGTALTAQDLTATDDTLTIDTVKAMLLYVDNVDKIQNKYSAANLWIDEAGKRLSNALDAKFLYQVVNANSIVDDATLGGTSGAGITPSVGTILQIFGAVNMKLDVQNVPEEERFFVISPQFYNVLWQYIAGKVTMLGDKTGENGNLGEYAGLQLYKSNNLTGSAQWIPTATPSNADTLTILGVVFTFVTTIGTTAGNVLIGGSISNSVQNIVALINAAGVGDAVNNVSLALADQRTVQQWVAVDVGAAHTTVEVRAMGASYLSLASSNASNPWSTTIQLQNLLAGRKGAIDVVVQREPSVDMASTVAAGKSGVNILPMTLAGFFVFHQGKNEIVWIKLNSSNY